MNRQIDPELPSLVFAKRRNRMSCAADIAFAVALKVRAFQQANKGRGAIDINADKRELSPLLITAKYSDVWQQYVAVNENEDGEIKHYGTGRTGPESVTNLLKQLEQ